MTPGSSYVWRQLHMIAVLTRLSYAKILHLYERELRGCYNDQSSSNTTPITRKQCEFDTRL